MPIPMPPSSSPAAMRSRMFCCSEGDEISSIQRGSRIARPNASSDDSSLMPIIAPIRAKAQFVAAP
jgi:hypothetical protein